MKEKHYAEYLKDISYEDIIFYGIGFFEKLPDKNGKVKNEDREESKGGI